VTVLTRLLEVGLFFCLNFCFSAKVSVELLHKYFKGNTTVEEEKCILSWVNESEENRWTLQKEHMLFDIALFTNTKINNKGEKVAVGTHILPMLR